MEAALHRTTSATFFEAIYHQKSHSGSSPTIDESCSPVLQDGIVGMDLASSRRHPGQPAVARLVEGLGPEPRRLRRHAHGGKRGGGTRRNGDRVNGKRINGMCTGGAAIPRRCIGRVRPCRKRLYQRYLSRGHILRLLPTNRRPPPITLQ